MTKGNHIFLTEEENNYKVYVCNSICICENAFTLFYGNSRHYEKEYITLFKTEEQKLVQLSSSFANFIYFSYKRIEE